MNITYFAARRNLLRLLAVSVVMPVIAILTACDHIPLYNKEKHELAKDANQAYSDAKVTEALNIQENNLKKILTAEIDALNESAALRLDISLLRMADDRPTPTGSTSLAAWYERGKREENALGFPTGEAILYLLDHQIEITAAWERIATIKARIASDGSNVVKSLPNCNIVNTPSASEKFNSAVECHSGRAFLEADYEQYVQECQNTLRPHPPLATGRVGAAFDELVKTEAVLAKQRQKTKVLTEQVKVTKTALITKKTEATEALEHTDNLQTNSKRIVAATKSISDEILSAVGVLGDVASSEVDVQAVERNISSIVTVLAAIGSGNANAKGIQDGKLKEAIERLKMSVPSLATDMDLLLRKSTAPPVANLILELQHQTINKRYAEALMTLSEKRIELLRGRYRALVDTAAAWRGFRLALCNFAVLTSSDIHPGEQCEKFEARSG